MTDTMKLDGGHADLDFEQYRPELTGYCYRMLGSIFEAEDAVQETMVRAWRGFDHFEGRAALRSWLYRIASNVCFDALKGRQRRAVPMDMMGPCPGNGNPDPPLPEKVWVGPVPDARIALDAGDPAERAVARESVRLAFVAALQHLPPRQRAVLILREVLKWRANEVAELLDTTVVSVNSTLQRARATLSEKDLTVADTPADALDAQDHALLARYVDAFERFDVDSLVKLLHDDATFTMPPFPFWLRGADQYEQFLRGAGSACEDSIVAPTRANGLPAFAHWKANPDGGYDAWGIQTMRLSDGRIAGIDFYIDANLFPLFGFPLHRDA
jgi:RNA polymerase sigma-70 factor (ECF subfamily)